MASWPCSRPARDERGRGDGGPRDLDDRRSRAGVLDRGGERLASGEPNAIGARRSGTRNSSALVARDQTASRASRREHEARDAGVDDALRVRGHPSSSSASEVSPPERAEARAGAGGRGVARASGALLARRPSGRAPAPIGKLRRRRAARSGPGADVGAGAERTGRAAFRRGIVARSRLPWTSKRLRRQLSTPRDATLDRRRTPRAPASAGGVPQRSQQQESQQR